MSTIEETATRELEEILKKAGLPKEAERLIDKIFRLTLILPYVSQSMPEIVVGKIKNLSYSRHGGMNEVCMGVDCLVPGPMAGRLTNLIHIINNKLMFDSASYKGGKIVLQIFIDPFSPVILQVDYSKSK